MTDDTETGNEASGNRTEASRPEGMSMQLGEAHGASQRFQVVVIGTGPVGKTSLINAMLRRSAGETGATIGTTRVGRIHTHTVQGIEGVLLLTDTPGLGEAGIDGSGREAEAIALASDADLVLFVVDHDLTRADRQVLLDLARLGKRLIVVLNKKDRLSEDDQEAILKKLGERLEGFLSLEDIVSVSAAPTPIQVRVRKLDGSTEMVVEDELPDLEALERRVSAVLEREGDTLRAGNLLLRGRIRERAERDRMVQQRRRNAISVIERHQWLAAGAAFANPVLVLAPMAAGAVQLRMLSEMATVYNAPLSSEFVENVGRQMAQTLFKLGVAEAAASMLGGLLKFNPLGFAAGGAVQAVTMAYLTRLTGVTFLEYLEHGQSWGEGGMQETLTRNLADTHKTEWLLHFSKIAINRILGR